MTDDQEQPVNNLSYQPPVSKLLEIGDPREMADPNWPETDYPERFQLSAPDIPDLVRMATDQTFYELDIKNIATWAPIHAWRALGQLRAVEAVPALLTLLPRVDEEDDEWVLEELPDVFELIGPPAVPALAGYVADPGNDTWARIPAATALQKIGNHYPEARAECVAALVRALENYQANDLDLNASLVLALAKLKAVEAAPLVEQAFQEEKVELAMMGDWEDWQYEVGLREEPPARRARRSNPLVDQLLGLSTPIPPTEAPKQAIGEGTKDLGKKWEKKEKKKRKEAKKARKRHRSKK